MTLSWGEILAEPQENNKFLFLFRSLSSENQSEESGMSDVVRYLRREKDILQLQAESSQHEIRRLSNQLEILNMNLEEAKLQLQEVAGLIHQPEYSENSKCLK